MQIHQFHVLIEIRRSNAIFFRNLEYFIQYNLYQETRIFASDFR